MLPRPTGKEPLLSSCWVLETIVENRGCQGHFVSQAQGPFVPWGGGREWGPGGLRRSRPQALAQVSASLPHNWARNPGAGRAWLLREPPPRCRAPLGQVSRELGPRGPLLRGEETDAGPSQGPPPSRSLLRAPAASCVSGAGGGRGEGGAAR